MMGDRPLRILHVVGAMNVGGTETMLMNIYRNVEKSKVRFDFISYSERNAYYDEEIRSMGGKIVILRKTNSITELYRAMKRNGPYDAVHSHTLFHCGIAAVAARLAGVKIVISHAHTTRDRSDGIGRSMYIRAMRTAIRLLSTQSLACSEEAGSYLFGPRSKYKHYPNLIDHASYTLDLSEEADRFKSSYRLDGDLVVGHVGRFIGPKNQAFLLDILHALLKKGADARLLLVGDGDLRPQLEKAAQERGIQDRIRFVGIRNDVPTMLQCMDVFAFPSLYEGLGLALLEAQASGLPCVVSEAIQPEADVGLGLITKVPLDLGADAWAETILRKRYRKEKDKRNIERAFIRHRCSVQAGISELMDLYRTGG